MALGVKASNQKRKRPTKECIKCSEVVASAKRKDERIIATVFGGKSGASRNAKVAELLIGCAQLCFRVRDSWVLVLHMLPCPATS